MSPRVVRARDLDDLADRAAPIVGDSLATAISQRGEAHIALTGGSTAAPLYARLARAPLRESVDWSRVHLWWGDERYVPTEHPDSNARLVEQVLLGVAARMHQSGEGAAGTDLLAGVQPGVPVPAAQVHPFPVNDAIGRGPGAEAWAARAYEEAIRELVPQTPDGLPVFDVVLLGVGPDGHMLSVFPRSRVLRDDAPLVVAVPAPDHIGPHVARLTLHPRILTAARTIVVMVSGAGKADVLAAIFGDTSDVERWPAQLALRDNAVWILDEAAAAKVPSHVFGSEPPVASARR